jgi:succinate-acetate transporter protein
LSTGEATSAQGKACNAAGSQVRVVLRPMAGATSLGLFGLGGAALALSGLQLGWVPAQAGAQVGLVLVAFAFPAQVITGLLSFWARDGATATVMCVLGLSWLVIGLMTMTSPAGARSEALGLFLILSALAVALTGITAGLSKYVMAIVLVTASLRFLLTGLFQLSGAEGWKTASGLLGLLLTLLAVYAAWAAELEDATGKSVLPTGRRGKGWVALHGDLLDQVKYVSGEAGVRARL